MQAEPHILVVDDDREIRTLLSRFLAKEGFRITAAADGREMRKILAEWAIDLVVLDLMLPDMPGKVMETLSAGQVDHLASMCITVASGVMRQSAAGPELQAMVLAKYPELPEAFVGMLTHGQCQMLLPENEAEPAKN